MSNQGKNRTGGVLPISATATKKNPNAAKPAQRSPAPKLRLIVRRLPPGLIESEFWDALGSEWQVGKGNVEWSAFKNGKVSKDPSKPSRPARAYLKVKDQSFIEGLSAKIKSTQFKDARNTTSDPSLVGPPSLEFAPYNKTPSGRIRNDGRQGTIDQDPEFIDFLQSLTAPITKSTINTNDSSDVKLEKVTMTPLVQFIKEKKANKAKEKEAAAAAKTAKKAQDTKDTKAKVKGEVKPTIIVKSSASSGDKNRTGKGNQDTAKLQEKPSTSTQPKTSNTKSEQKVKDSASSHTPAPKKERERGNASAAVKMISRDLGLTPREPKASRAAKTGAPTSNEAKNETVKGSTAVTTTDVNLPKTASTTPAANPPPAGSRNKNNNQTSKAKQTATAAAASPQVPSSQKSQSQQTSLPKSAFLKHANPSQGITEELLHTTFAEFGEITKCEIDKKKGLAYIDFSEPESLKKAMSASPVKVANGQVIVLENKSPYRKTAQHRGANDSGNAAQSQARSTSTTDPAVSSPQPKKANVVTAPAMQAESEQGPQADATTGTTGADPPTASRGGRGGSKTSRGGGKGAQNSENSKAGSGNRGGGRGGSRGNRGRGGRAANAQNNAGTAQTTATSTAPSAPATGS